MIWFLSIWAASSLVAMVFLMTDWVGYTLSWLHSLIMGGRRML